MRFQKFGWGTEAVLSQPGGGERELAGRCYLDVTILWMRGTGGREQLASFTASYHLHTMHSTACTLALAENSGFNSSCTCCRDQNATTGGKAAGGRHGAAVAIGSDSALDGVTGRRS